MSSSPQFKKSLASYFKIISSPKNNKLITDDILDWLSGTNISIQQLLKAS